MTMNLFEVGDAHKQNEILLKKDLTQSRDDLKVQTIHV